MNFELTKLSYFTTISCITFLNVRCADKQTATFKNNTTFLKPFTFINFFNFND